MGPNGDGPTHLDKENSLSGLIDQKLIFHWWPTVGGGDLPAGRRNSQHQNHEINWMDGWMDGCIYVCMYE